MVSGPEVSRVVKEFEASFLVAATGEFKHHEQTLSVQQSFVVDVNNLVAVIDGMGNPFKYEGDDLIRLDSKIIQPDCVVNTVKNAYRIGISQYEEYTCNRLQTCKMPITDTIKRNSLPLLGFCGSSKQKTKAQMSALKNDCSLFSRLYITSQVRQGNMAEFSKHENQVYPPSLSNMGEFSSCVKSELIEWLGFTSSPVPSSIDMKALDGAVIVNMLTPDTNCKTFDDYAKKVFLPYIKTQAQNVKRLDVVWDTYLQSSLKYSSRLKRGNGTHRKVVAHVNLPSNWQSFLRVDVNKSELFSYLANQISMVTIPGVEVITSLNTDILCPPAFDKVGLALCNHEEADTRLILHIAHAARQGCKNIQIRTVDTDVVVLALAYFQKLGITRLWIAFGNGKHYRILAIHDIAQSLGQQMCEGMPFFHAFTGCDTVSSFSGRGKPTAFSLWKTFNEVTPIFGNLSKMPMCVSDEEYKVLQRFVVLLYSRTSSIECVNAARQSLFSQGNRTIENIPPTKAALEQHVKRAAYQGGIIWGQAMVCSQEIVNPTEWGWKLNDGVYSPIWTELPDAAKVCQELIHCSCKKACRGLCKCYKANMRCTALCVCEGNCHQD